MYDFLLVINTNYTSYLAPFPRAVDSPKSLYLAIPLLCLTPPAEGFPRDDLREIFSLCQWMAKVPNAVEILPKIWNAWVGRTNVKDDRRTVDGIFSRLLKTGNNFEWFVSYIMNKGA